MKRLLSVVLSAAMLLSLIPVQVAVAQNDAENTEVSHGNFLTTGTEFSGGTGTSDDPYQIRTKEHLNNVRNYLSACFILMDDIVFNDADFAVDGAFYNEGRGWEPVGDSTAPFTGVFDGNGHAISGLMTSGYEYAGLFGYAKGASITELGIENGKISAAAPNAYAGGVVGYVDSSTIMNCYNTGDVSASATSFVPASSDVYAGGIAGSAVNSGVVASCYNTGTVSAVSPIAEAYVCSGGIAGCSSGTIENCYNAGDVSSSLFAGGVSGCSSGSITNCYNLGATSGRYSAGGIAGEVTDGIITNCYYLNRIAQGIGSGDGNTTRCTLLEMEQRETYTGFDFDAVWTMGGEKYPLPILQRLGEPAEWAENTTEFAGGSGTPMNPYLISSKQHLDNVRKYPAASFKLLNNIAFAASDFSESGVYYNEGKGWEPIGNQDEPFSGIFDGDDYIISGVKTSGYERAGLFGYVYGGTITDLGMDKSWIQASPTPSSSTGAYAGGIVGSTWNSTITNCYNTGAVSATADGEAYVFAGGIAGSIYNSTIMNCYSLGAVSTDFMAPSGGDYAGGIVGDASVGTITDCYNTGAVSGSRAGGIAGSMGGSITDCYNTGAVSGSQAGGIAGYVSGGITDCYNTGAVSATSSSYAYGGGIAGDVSNGIITNNYNTGSVSATSSDSYAYGGGIAGRVSDSTVTGCYNTGTVSVDDASYAGGIAGNVSSSSITNCYYLDCVDVGIGFGNGDTTRCTLTEMQQQETYAGFDFDTVWTMEGNAAYLLPELQGMEMVSQNAVAHLAVSRVPDKTQYIEGNQLDLTGGEITVIYYNGTTQVLPITKEMVTGFDSAAVGKQTITVNYDHKSATFQVEVLPKTLLSIAVTTMPETVNYLVNQGTLDLTGGAITLIYNNDTTQEVPLTEEMVSGFDGSIVGKQTITVNYLGCTTSFEVEVFEKELVSISISSLPDKIRYLVDQEELDLTGGKVMLHYYNGITKELDLTEDMVSGFDNSTVGTQTLTVTYEGYTTMFEVEIIANGDLDGDGVITSSDAVYLLNHTLFPDLYPAPAGCDYDGDGAITSGDAVYLLNHTLFPDLYPLA